MLDHDSILSSVSIDGIQLKTLESMRISKSSKGRVIHLHGFPGAEVGEFKELHRYFIARGYSIISVNYPGMWASEGEFSLHNSISLLIEFVKLEVEKHGSERIFLYGESFGGYIACILGSILAQNITKIAMRAPFPGLDMIDSTKNNQFHKLFLRSIALLIQSGILRIAADAEEDLFSENGNNYDLKDHLKQLNQKNIPLYAFIGKNDEILPYEKVKETYQVFTDFEVYDQLSHNVINQQQMSEIMTKIDIFYSSN